MKQALYTILSLIASLSIGQQLDISAGTRMDVAGTSGLEILGNLSLNSATAQLVVVDDNNPQSQAYVLVIGNYFSVGTTTIENNNYFQLDGDLTNDGNLENLGIFALGGDWLTNNLFNSIGELQFVGNADQQIVPAQIITGTLGFNQSGMVRITQTDLIVMDELSLNTGILEVTGSAKLVVEDGANVNGGSSDSYVDGRMVHLGTGDKVFPVGKNGTFGKLTVIGKSGAGTDSLSLVFSDAFPVTPAGDVRTLLAISPTSLWTLEQTGGAASGRLEVEFENADLTITNPIRHSFRMPTIVASDTLEGTYVALDPEPILRDTDSLTFGTVEMNTEFTLDLEDQIPTYVAIGLIPIVPPDGVIYIPTAFSPIATDPLNQTFRVFSDKIENTENFLFEVYNKFGVKVYTTNDFNEARDFGWDGSNEKTGNDEPTGTYLWVVRFLRENGDLFEKKGAVYLQR